LKLDLTGFLPEIPEGELAAAAAAQYDLCAVSHHHGDTRGGHYTAEIRGLDGKWWRMDDSRCSEVDPSPAAEEANRPGVSSEAEEAEVTCVFDDFYDVIYTLFVRKWEKF